MADVFVSYSREDIARVRPLVAALEAEGFSVWWDRVLAPGERFAEVIDQQIQAARCVLVVWSSVSVASQWVKNEALEGMDREVLVPILLEPVRLPVAFKQHQIADFTRWPEQVDQDQYRHLVGVIHRLVRGDTGQPIAARAVGQMNSGRRRSFKAMRRYIVAPLVLILVALALTLAFEVRSPPTTKTATRLTVNRFSSTGGGDSPFYADSVTREMQRSLESIKGIDLVRVGSIWDLNWHDVPDAISKTATDYIVSGDVSTDNNQLRVKVALSDAPTGKVLWTETLEDAVSDVADIQQQIVEAVLAEVKLASASSVAFNVKTRSITRDKVAYRDYLIGQDLLRRGEEQNVRKAIGRFDEAVSRDPGFVQAIASTCHGYLDLFRATKAVDDFNAGKKNCEKVLAMDKTSVETHLALAELYRASGELRPAKLEYLDALELAPADPDGQIGLADVLVKQGNLQGGEDLYSRAVRDNPTYWKAQNALGTYYFRHGMFNRAIESYTRVTELTSSNAVAFSNLGAAKLYAGDFDGATRAWRRANELDTNSASFSNLGTALYYQGKFKEALKQYKAALAMDPGDHRLWGNVADNLDLIPGRRDDARKAYEKAISLATPIVSVNANDAYTLSRLSVYYAAVGQRAAANDMAQRAEKLAGLDLNVLYDLTVSSALLGDRHRSREYAEKALNAGYPAVLLKSDPQLTGIGVTQ